jgi:WD40 repeat protein
VLRHPYAVFSVAWSPDGTQIAVGGMLDPRVSIWDPHGGTLLRTLGDRSGGVAALAYYPNGRFLAVGRGFVGADHLSIDVFDARTGGFVRALPGPSTVRGRNNVSALAASSNGRYLAAGYFATVVLYDAVTGQPIRSLALPEKQSTTWVALAFSPAGTLLAGGATGGTVQLWEVTTGASVSTIEGHSDAVRALAFSPDGSHLASGTRTGNTSGKVDESTRQFVRRTTYDPIRIWDAGTGKLIRGLPGHTWHVQALLFSRSGERLFSGSGDRSLRIWSAGTGSLLETSTGHGDQVWSLASSPDDTLLASAGGSAVTIWRLRKDSE